LVALHLVLSADSLSGNGLEYLTNLGASLPVRAFSFLLAAFMGFTKRIVGESFSFLADFSSPSGVYRRGSRGNPSNSLGKR
jgi:hypothetical protein